MQQRKRLRELISSGSTVWIPGAYDALSAKLIEDAGFEAVLVSGFGLSASLLGMPDAELYTQTENLSVVRNVVAAVRIPVMADVDNGYGNAINVIRTVREFEAAGAASITLEDQVSPKACPLLGPGDVLPLAEAVGKIRAAVSAHRDPDLMIIARTDSHDPQEALQRCKAYADAGADLVKATGTAFQDFNRLLELRAHAQRPLAVSIAGDIENHLSVQQLERLGGIVTFPLAPLMTVTAALQANLAYLVRTRRLAGMPVQPMPEKDFLDFIGVKEIRELERRYLVDKQTP